MMNLPPPPEVTPRIGPKIEKPEKVDKKDDLFKPSKSEEKEDDRFAQEVALASGNVVAPFQPLFQSWIPLDFDESEPSYSLLAPSTGLSSVSSNEPIQPISEGAVSNPVFFALPPSEIKVDPAELFAQAPLHLSPAAVSQWVAGEVRKMEQGGKTLTQLTVQLDPPHLGQLQLTLSMADRRVAVEIFASSQAKPLLETSLASIRAILASQNLSTGDIRISAHPAKNSSNREGDYPQANRWAKKRSGEDDGLSVTS